jgi:hypothetical protein
MFTMEAVSCMVSGIVAILATTPANLAPKPIAARYAPIMTPVYAGGTVATTIAMHMGEINSGKCAQDSDS